MVVIVGIAAGVTILSVMAFAGYLVAMVKSPSTGRPRTPVYNRLGQEMSPEENPGYQETEDEKL